MTGSLLGTKFYAPRRRSGLVPRPNLTERVRRGTLSSVTLVSAPAGFGKSTLLAEWLAAAPPDGSVIAWLSLDGGDDHPDTFWTHVIAALAGVAPGIGARSSTLLESPEAPIDAVLAPLLNELSALPNDVTLVLDDYHVIDAPPIQAGMTFLLEHLPARLHLVIATRADPALPLARLRARGELVEIRASDLRFTPDEAAAYLNGTMGLTLATGDVAALERRTEGWIAAIQLAGLSMQGRDDTSAFIAGFAGDDRYIVDYLVEEVLQRQAEEIRTFLLETSILDRLTGPLCDAVTGQHGGRSTLETLDRRNVFLVPLDDRRRWYRYHHLFADVLRARLLDERPAMPPILHRRAADWYEQQGDRAEAIGHSMAGGDLERSADLVELVIPAMSQRRQEATVRRWLEAIPDEVIRIRPVLSDAYAGSILVRGEVEGVESRLEDAERWLDATPARSGGAGGAAAMVVADDDAFRRLPASIAIHRAGLALILGDLPGTMAQAERALDVVAADDHLHRGGAAVLLGLASWASGDLDGACRSYADGIASLERAGHLSDAIGCALALADIRLSQGRLGEALRIRERGLALATGQDGPVARGAADMHVGISEILRERDDLEGARRHLAMGADLGEENGLPQNRYRSRVALARLRQAEGDLEGALDLLGQAELSYVGDFSPNIRPVGAVAARALIAGGRLPDAWRWARAQGLSADDDLTYLHEFEHITLARLLLAQGLRDRADDAIGVSRELAERLLAAADAGGRDGSVIDIQIVLALAYHALRDPARAAVALDRAVAVAEPEGYVRIFLDEGPPASAVLRQAASSKSASSYLRRLVAATSTTPRPATVGQPLIEPLSDRELEVLRLLEGDLDGPDMARELSVSLATVRTHTRNIYAKLGVNSRRAAVSRALELGLLARASERRPTA